MSNFDQTNYGKRRAKTPSFSSILLDAIYRSIDDTDVGATRDDHNYDYTTSDHNYDYNNYSKQRSKMRSDSTFETLNLGHAIMIDSWMEQQQSQPYDHGNVDDDQSIRTVHHRPVPSRATTVVSDNFSKIHTSCFAPTTKRETASSRIFTKTKSKAMKIYGDLKKNPPKSPTSPGAKIAAFINSIFRNSGNRKPNNSPPPPVPEPSTSTSCLSKTTSSRGKSSSTSRSVRFYTVDEDSSPGNHRMNPSKSRREKAKEIDALMTMITRDCREREEGEASLSLDGINGGAGRDEEMNGSDDGGDGESCASSDLFELESLSCIGVSRYAEELPVYGTTSLHMIKG